MRRYYSRVSKILRFEISDGGWFLVSDMSNAKYLAFDTLDGNALSIKYP